MDGAVERVHATAIAVGTRAILIRGPSGSGKSDLALRCLTIATSQLIASPARLVADDQVLLRRDGTALHVSAPPTLLGKIEVRGLGILNIDPVTASQLALIADITDPAAIERYPDPWPAAILLGLRVPVIRVAPFYSSAPLKLLAALAMPSLPPVDHAP